jgi:cysteine desulfurase
MQRIYLDNSATTPIDPLVIERMQEIMADNYGNPSSIHAEGRKSRAIIEAARKRIAHHLNCSIGEIFFTSGGTEASNMILKNSVRDLGVTHIISSPIEHHCVLHTLESVEKADGVEISMVKLNQEGSVDLDHLASLIKDPKKGKTLVSLMHANNEVGTRLDLDAVSQLCKEEGALFHTDTVQTIGYYAIDLEATPINFLAGSAHKFYGPKGIGFVYINGDNIIKPYLDGGAQERNMRGGTENIYGIAGMATALDLAYENLEERQKNIRLLRDYFAVQIENNIPGAAYNGDPIGGHYKILSVSFPPSAKGEMLLMNLDMAGISASGGSACSSGIDVGSHVVGHLHPDSPRHTIRFSLSHHNTKEEIDYVVEKLKSMV